MERKPYFVVKRPSVHMCINLIFTGLYNIRSILFLPIKLRLIKYVQTRCAETTIRIPCAELRDAFNLQFHGDTQLNDREFGLLLRTTFPTIRRKRSNNTNYYDNISIKIPKVDREVQVTEEQLSGNRTVLSTVQSENMSKIRHVKRM